MKNSDSHFNVDAQVRIKTRPGAIAPFLPIALFAALVAALAVVG